MFWSKSTALRPISPIAPHQFPRISMADEKQRAVWRAASIRYAMKNRELVLARNREAKRKKAEEDPVWREENNFKKRAKGLGFTKKQWEKMFDSQGRVCAICGSDSPHHKKGWQLDHCHKTNTARFILCTHCNRGLSGFRDNPDLMRKAADALDEFNSRPVED